MVLVKSEFDVSGVEFEGKSGPESVDLVSEVPHIRIELCE